MELYLRVYTIRPGELDEWIDEWRTHVVPLRRAHGFEVLGAWASEFADHDASTFAWLLGYPADDGFEAANDAYYASPDRRAVSPDPARHILDVRQVRVRPVELP